MAIAAFRNSIVPPTPITVGPATRFCVTPELLVIPGPLMVKVTHVWANLESAVILKLLAPGLKYNLRHLGHRGGESKAPDTGASKRCYLGGAIGHGCRRSVGRGVPVSAGGICPCGDLGFKGNGQTQVA